MTEALSAALLAIGATFMVLAAVGVLRMPDLFTRMQAVSKAATLGAGCVLLALAIHAGSTGVTVRALAVILFLFLTAPVAAHMIARAAHFVGVPQWEKAVRDDLKGCYDPQTHVLGSEPHPNREDENQK